MRINATMSLLLLAIAVPAFTAEPLTESKNIENVDQIQSATNLFIGEWTYQSAGKEGRKVILEDGRMELWWNGTISGDSQMQWKKQGDVLKFYTGNGRTSAQYMEWRLTDKDTVSQSGAEVGLLKRARSPWRPVSLSAPAPELPRSFDLRPRFKELGLPVQNQGQTGTCEVFACVAGLEYQLARKGEPVILSRQFARWAANSVGMDVRTRNYRSVDIFGGIKKFGICADKLMPYRDLAGGVRAPSQEALTDAATRKQVTMKNFFRPTSISGNRERMIMEICRSIADDCPVTFGGFLPQHHAALLVGYRLDKKIFAEGCFIVRDSFGELGKDGGHRELKFGNFRNINEAYAVIPE